MFGPSSRASPSSQRRARRRIALIAAIGLVVALIAGEVIDQVVNSAAPAARRSSASWVAAVSPLLASSAALAPQLRQLRFAPASLDRQRFDLLAGDLVAESAALVTSYHALGLGEPLPNAAAALDELLTRRASGTAAFARAADLATSGTGNGAVSRAATMFSAAGVDLLAAERANVEFRDDLGHLADDVVDARWIYQASNWSPSALSAYAHELASLSALQARPAISIAAVSVGRPVLKIVGLPAPTTTTTALHPTVTTTTVFGAPSTTTRTTTTTSTTIVPPTSTAQIPPSGAVAELLPTSSIAVRIVVDNSGNTTLHPVVVQTRLAPGSQRSSSVLGTVVAGDARYVRAARFSVRGGHSYTLVVTASAPGAHATTTVHLKVDA